MAAQDVDLALQRGFLDSQYPEVGETIVHDASTLYKQKKGFIQDFGHSLRAVSAILSGLLYLKDNTIAFFLLHQMLILMLDHPLPMSALQNYSRIENRRVLARYLLTMVAAANFLPFACHILFMHYYTHHQSQKYLYGSLSVQFVGETVPTSIFPILILDVILAITLYVFFHMKWVVEESEILESKLARNELYESENACSQHPIGSGGSCGSVELLTIDIYAGIKKVLSFSELDEYSENLNTTMNEENPTASTAHIGSFV